MKAIGFDKSLVITDEESFIEFETEIASPTGYDLLVKISAISINPVDFKIRKWLIQFTLDSPPGLCTIGMWE